ncbi:MAG: FtsX-like permease family protein [Planctomycetota bacterium]
MALRSLRRHALVSVLTIGSVALGAGLSVAVLRLAQGAQGAFERTALGVPVLVAGTKGSRIDALLSTLYHTGRTPGRVSRAYVEELQRDRRVEWAIPIALGDRASGFPLVGTTNAFFEPGNGQVKALEGRRPEPGKRWAVAGAATPFRVGDKFVPSHAGIEGDRTHIHEMFTVVGRLASTNSSHDRAVWIALEDFLSLSGHGEPTHVSAVFLKPKSNSPAVVEPLLRDINESVEAQAIRPLQVVAELMALFGTAERVLRIVGWLVLFVAVLSVSLSLYALMASRTREVAVLRALGAPRGFLVVSVMTESALLCLVGALLGIVLGHVGAQAASPMVTRYAGAAFEPGGLHAAEFGFVLVIAGVGGLAGVLPAWRAYRVDVAAGLE